MEWGRRMQLRRGRKVGQLGWRLDPLRTLRPSCWYVILLTLAKERPCGSVADEARWIIVSPDAEGGEFYREIYLPIIISPA